MCVCVCVYVYTLSCTFNEYFEAVISQTELLITELCPDVAIYFQTPHNIINSMKMYGLKVKNIWVE